MGAIQTYPQQYKQAHAPWAVQASSCTNFGIPRQFTWHDKRYTIQQIGGHWCRRGRWWQGEGYKRYFRILTTHGVVLDLCLNEATGAWNVAMVHD